MNDDLDQGGAAAEAAGDDGAGAEAAAYELPASFAPFRDQIQQEHLGALEQAAREQGLDQAGFEALIVDAYGDPGGKAAQLQEHFGEAAAVQLRAVKVFAAELARHHPEATGRLAAEVAGVKLLDALRRDGAGGIDLAEHGEAVRTLRASEAGKTLLHAIEQAGNGLAMPGVPAAARSSSQAERRTAGGKSEDELRSMMRDPRYWRDKDPAVVGEVTRGFEELYQGTVPTAAIAPSSGRGR